MATLTKTKPITRTTGRTGRFYDITDATGADAPLPVSVTTILGAITKPALVDWAAKEERTLVTEAAAALYADTQQLATPLPRAAYLLALEQRLGQTKAHVKALAAGGRHRHAGAPRDRARAPHAARRRRRPRARAARRRALGVHGVRGLRARRRADAARRRAGRLSPHAPVRRHAGSRRRHGRAGAPDAPRAAGPGRADARRLAARAGRRARRDRFQDRQGDLRRGVISRRSPTSARSPRWATGAPMACASTAGSLCACRS